MGLIFSALYPQERFNPLTSVQRIRNSVLRFNQWSESKVQGFQIQIEKGDFFLRSKLPGIGISLQVRPRPRAGWQIHLQHFRKSFGARSFSSSDFAQFFEVTQRTANSILKLTVENKTLLKIGKGSATKYAFSGANRKTE